MDCLDIWRWVVNGVLGWVLKESDSNTSGEGIQGMGVVENMLTIFTYPLKLPFDTNEL